MTTNTDSVAIGKIDLAAVGDIYVPLLQETNTDSVANDNTDSVANGNRFSRKSNRLITRTETSLKGHLNFELDRTTLSGLRMRRETGRDLLGRTMTRWRGRREWQRRRRAL